MIIHLSKTCGAFDYKERLEVDTYETEKEHKGTAISVAYKNKMLIIPLNNILAIEVV